MFNATGLLVKHTHGDRFINALTISDIEDEILRAARRKIRAAIRSAFRQARQFVKAELQPAELERLTQLKPKFLTQGSYAYKALNRPCHSCQQIDLDDGVYLPMSFINKAPAENKDWFFWIVDGALRQLANQEGWKFSDEKSTCARIIISRNAHIDVPLYAIPDYRHAQIVEAAAALSFSTRMSTVMFAEDLSLAKPVKLDEDEVYLAHRKDGWKNSDPVAISDWFNQQILLRGQGSGQRLRRVCRFLKAWRDYYWPHGGPSSLTLMVCAVEAYPEDDRGRDDYALLKISEALPSRLADHVDNPAHPYEKIYPRGDIDVGEVADRSRRLRDRLNAALHHSQNKAAVIDHFVTEFGGRMPTNEEWVVPLSAVEEIVRRTPARKVRPDRIPNTRAG